MVRYYLRLDSDSSEGFYAFSQDIGNAILHRHTERRIRNDHLESWAQLGEMSGSGEGIDCVDSGRFASMPRAGGDPHAGAHGVP